MNTLVVRPDRLGDVILSTPVLEALHRQSPETQITVLVRSNVVPLLAGLPSVKSCLIFDPAGRHQGVRGFLNLVLDIRAGRFASALVLQSHRKIAMALFFARVPVRLGPYSKIHSYLFYNRGLRQRRSQVEMHEADYNLQLLEKLGFQIPSTGLSTKVAVAPGARKSALDWLAQKGWRRGERKWVAVHPGMGGSALNWPEEHYVELIAALLDEGMGVLVTTGPDEQGLLSRFSSHPLLAGRGVVFYSASKEDSIEFLAGLYSQMDLVVAPSTGPLHLAVALGRPVLSFYPTLKVQSIKRWGPYGVDSQRAIVLQPQSDCAHDRDCMKSLSVQEAWAACRKLLGLNPASPPST